MPDVLGTCAARSASISGHGALVGGCNPSGERSLGKNILLGAVARISGLEQDQRLCLFLAYFPLNRCKNGQEDTVDVCRQLDPK